MEVDPTGYLPASLVLGISDIDEQHGMLFAQFQEIKRACLEKNCLPPALGKALLASLAEHFATEQRFAEAAGIYFHEHARAHQRALAGLSKAFASVTEGTQDVFGVLRFIEYWFERHITEFDLPLGQRILEATLLRSERKSQRLPLPVAPARVSNASESVLYR